MLRIGAHAPRQLEPVDARQPDVDDGRRGLELIEQCEPRRAVVRRPALEARVSQQGTQHFTTVGIVFDDDDSGPTLQCRPGGTWLGFCLHDGCYEWKTNDELAALPFAFASCADRATVLRDQPTDQGKPDAEPASGTVQ